MKIKNKEDCMSSSPSSSSRKKLDLARILSRKLSLSDEGKTGCGEAYTPRLEGEERVVKFGKKLDGKYVLISAYIKPPAQLRFVVYEASTCARYALTIRRLESLLDEDETSRVKSIVRDLASKLSFAKDGRTLVLDSSVECLWTSSSCE